MSRSSTAHTGNRGLERVTPAGVRNLQHQGKRLEAALRGEEVYQGVHGAWRNVETQTFAPRPTMRNFVDHVHHGKETMAPGEHGLMVQKMLDGIYESAGKGREVRIK